MRRDDAIDHRVIVLGFWAWEFWMNTRNGVLNRTFTITIYNNFVLSTCECLENANSYVIRAVSRLDTRSLLDSRSLRAD
jgi:hypothetical protein